MSLPSALNASLARPLSPAGRERRAALAPLLAAQWESAPDAAEARALDRLGHAGSLLVSGQQAGLALGTFLLLSKCTALLALADRVEAAGHARPLTVFWLEGNDHDWREAASPGRPLPEGWSAPAPAGAEGHPVSRIVPDTAWWAGQQAALAPVLEGLDEPLGDGLRAALRGSLVEHTRRLLRGLFAGSGLLVLDPADPALRALAAPFARRLQEHAAGLGADLRARTDELKRQGRRTPVEVDERPPWFTEDEAGRRRRAEPGESVPAERFSPNVLTRPLLQDWLLEPAAALLGPSELAYTAQAETARARLELPAVLPLARPTVQLIRRADHSALRSAGLDPWNPPQPGQPWPEELLLGLPGGSELAARLALLEQARAEIGGLCAAAGRPDLEQLGRRQEALAEQIRQALWTAHKAGHKDTLRRLHGLAAWQDGPDSPQERRLNALALLARLGGPAVLAGLRRELDPLAAGQQRFVCDPMGGVERE
ncbi:MAG: bacillithiol biosynthesis BshC [Candidatus Delongbacteria bacterium]